MKQDDKNYFMVGLFVLSMMVLLFIVMVKINGDTGDTASYFVTYNNVAGLREGTAITYGGFQIGQVSDIRMQQNGGKTSYQIEMVVRADWKIPIDSMARIVSPGVLSDNQIDIAEGNSTSYLEPGGPLQGEGSKNIFAAVDDVAYELKDLSQNSLKPMLREFSDSLASATTSIDNLGRQFDNGVPTLFASAQYLLTQLNDSASKLSVILNTKNQNHIAGFVENADQVSRNLLKLSKQFDASLNNIDNLLDRTNRLVDDNDDDFRKVAIDLRKSLGTVSQSIDSIVYNLDTTSRNLNEFSRQIRSNPGVLMSGTAPKDDGVVSQ